jgi:diacylglycerol O-acyltransferase
MPDRYPMSDDDALWLNIERPEQGTMVDGAFVFADQITVDEVLPVVMERMVDRYPVMRRRPLRTDDGWFWEDDESFDIRYHVLDVELRSADVEELRRHISRQRSTLLSRTHPMWQIHVIRNVAGLGDGNGSVVLARWHHSIADGIRLVQLLLSLCDVRPEAGVPNVGRDLGQSTASSRMGVAARQAADGTRDLLGGATEAATGAARRVRAAAGETGNRVIRMASDPAAAIGQLPSDAARLAGEGGSLASTLLGRGASAAMRPGRLVEAAVAMTETDNRVANTLGASVKLALPAPTTKTVWTGEPGSVKDAYWCPPIPLERIARVRARHPGSTVNDVLLTILAAALREYLREHGDDNPDTTGWFIPASIKPLDKNLPTELGNHFVGLVAELPVSVDDPAEILEAVTARMARIKNSDEAFLAFGLQKVLAHLPDKLSDTLLWSLFDKVNGSLVSVPGPRATMSLAGHDVIDVLAFSPTVGNGPIVVTFFTYRDSVTAAMTLDRKLIPDTGRLPQLLNEQAEAVLSALGGSE